jgi:hypothetical protein
MPDKPKRSLVNGGAPGGAFMALLKSWGAPDNLVEFTLRVRARRPVEVVCVYHPEGEDGQLLVIDDALQLAVRRFHLIDPDEDEAP